MHDDHDHGWDVFCKLPFIHRSKSRNHGLARGRKSIMGIVDMAQLLGASEHDDVLDAFHSVIIPDQGGYTLTHASYRNLTKYNYTHTPSRVSV